MKSIKKSKARRGAVAEHNNYLHESRNSGKPFILEDLPKRELVILYLKSNGYTVVPGRSSLYLTMQNPEFTDLFFVGAKGGVWFGRNVSEMIGHSLSGATRESLIRKLIRLGY